jgi:hypothetical protein
MYFTLQWMQGSKLLILGILEEDVSRRGIDTTTSSAEEEMLHTYYSSIQSDAGTTTDRLTTKHSPFRWKQRCIRD